jgi:hypothetical protein
MEEKNVQILIYSYIIVLCNTLYKYESSYPFSQSPISQTLQVKHVRYLKQCQQVSVDHFLPTFY